MGEYGAKGTEKKAFVFVDDGDDDHQDDVNRTRTANGREY